MSTPNARSPFHRWLADHVSMQVCLAFVVAVVAAPSCGKPGSNTGSAEGSESSAELTPAAAARQARKQELVEQVRQRMQDLGRRLGSSDGTEPDLQGIQRAYCAPAADTDWPADALVKALHLDQLLDAETARNGPMVEEDINAVLAEIGPMAKTEATRIGAIVLARCKRPVTESEVLAGLDGRLGPGFDRSVSLDVAYGLLQGLREACQESFTDLLPAIRSGVEEQKRQHPSWTLRYHDWHAAFVTTLVLRADDRSHGKKVKCARLVPWVVGHAAPPP